MIGELLLQGGSYCWPDSPVARTDYPTLMFHGECDPPLAIGSEARVGRYRLIVIDEDPATATVLVRQHGLWGWLRWMVWRAKGLIQ